jgi:hypothetical protein
MNDTHIEHTILHSKQYMNFTIGNSTLATQKDILSENNYTKISTRNTKQHKIHTTKRAAYPMGHISTKNTTSRYTKVA